MLNLTEEEAKEQSILNKKLNIWVSYADNQHKLKQPLDYSLDLSDEEYFRLDQLAFKSFSKKIIE